MAITTSLNSDISNLNSYFPIHGYLYLIVSSTTLLLYDIGLTFDQEVKYIWKRKFNLASYIFIFNRYLCVLSVVMAILVSLIPNDSDVSFSACLHSCIVANDVWLIVDILTSGITSAFFIIRIWAMWNYRRITLIILIPPMLISTIFFMAIVVMTRFSFISEDSNVYSGCRWKWNSTEPALKSCTHFSLAFAYPH
ncbi:hypothetical protein ABKN59_010558 [Abortiporus biennis]